MVSLMTFFTNREVNVTYLTLGGFVQVLKYRYLYFLMILTVFLLSVLFNATILCVIWNHKNLHEPMYIFIAALLINSVFFSINIYPKLLIDFLSEKQVISYSVCLFQSFLFYCLGGSEFLLLAAMSYDRYVSICKPLQYPTIMRKTTIIVVLVVAWLLPACQLAASCILQSTRKLCGFTLKGIFCNNALSKLNCSQPIALALYGLVTLFSVALFPLLFILFTYTRILIISYRSSRDIRKKAAQTCLPHLIVLISFSCFCLYDFIIVRVESGLPKTVHFAMTLQVVLYHPLINPIIYGLKMKEIYKHIRQLFTIRSSKS